MKITQNKLPKSQIEIDFELDEQEFQKHIDKALLHLKEHVKIDGFRKGHVPEKMVEEKVGNENLLMEAGDLAVKESYTKFIKDLSLQEGNTLEPIGQPEVQILKIAKGSPFLFKMKISVLPEIKLPDYKGLASRVKAQKIAVDEKDIIDALNYLQRSRAKFSQEDRPAQAKDFIEIEYKNENINNGKEVKDKFILGEGGFMKDFEDNLIGMKAGEEKEFMAKFPDNTPNRELAGNESQFKVKMALVQKMELPEINDEFAKSLGAFDNLVVLKENIKEGITIEKQEGEKQRKRGEILNNILQKIDFDLPEKMVEYEEKRLFEDFKDQIAQNAKMDFDEYLTSIKKSEDEIKKSFTLEAEKRIKNFLMLRQIGKAENIQVENEELEGEMNKAIKNYSKEELQKIDIQRLREYSKGEIYNEKVFEKLESFSK